MSQDQSSNKRIAKNTVMLYIRMFINMLVGLYTSRVVLQTLGVVDYGIYGVVGGVVTMFSFFSGTLTTASYRFLTIELGKGDAVQLHKVFCTCVQIHFIFAVIILVLVESLGPWFIDNKMTIPPDRLAAAHWVFHCSLIACLINVASLPYSALVMVHEHMNVYAYFSILESLLKLLIVYLLLCFDFDKLILYSFLVLVVSIIMRMTYCTYGKRKFEESKYEFIFDKNVFRSICNFSLWLLLSSLAGMGLTQGLSVLLNIFFGPVVNAARTIGDQVMGMVGTFTGGFTTALNPQITKQYAARNFTRMHLLIVNGCKYSFFLLYVLALPVFVEIDTILHVWLGIVPDHAVEFSRLCIIISLINTLSVSTTTGIHATGNIRKYTTGQCIANLLVLPISYLLLKGGMDPEVVFYLQIVTNVFLLIYRLMMCVQLFEMPVVLYCKSVLLRVSPVVIVSFMLTYAFSHYVVPDLVETGFWSMMIVSLFSVVANFLSIYYLGLACEERSMFVGYIRRRFLKFWN